MNQPPRSAEQIIRILQNIVAVLALVLLVVPIVFYVIRFGDGSSPPLTFLMGLHAVLMVPVRWVASIVGSRRGRKEVAKMELTSGQLSDDQRIKLAQTYQFQTIFGRALMAGPAYANIYASFMDHTPIGLVIAGVLLLAVLFPFPTQNGFDHWCEKLIRATSENRMVNRQS